MVDVETYCKHFTFVKTYIFGGACMHAHCAMLNLTLSKIDQVTTDVYVQQLVS